MNRLVLILLIIGSVFFGLIIYFSSGFSLSGACGYDLLYETKSHNELFEARVFEMNCGATTDFTTAVSLMKSESESVAENEIIFLADDNHNEAPHGRGRSPRVEMEWISHDTLKLMYHPKVRVFNSVPEKYGIVILYEESLE